MRKFTKLLTLALAALMIIGAMPASAAFTDVAYEDEALYDAVELLTTLGVAKGTSETTFGPDELVTRQQMAAFVYRLMKAGRSSEGGTNTTPFTDLVDSTYFNMVSWASSSGIIKGRSATEFDPTGNIVLQDAYTMLVRALGYEKDGALNYPFDFIDTAESIGLDENIPSTVDYTDNLTRGQVAILLANAFYADMNETVIKYEWVQNPNGTDTAYVPVEKNETVAHKIFGVEEEKFIVTATTHYGFDGTASLYNENTDVDLIKGNRYDENGDQIVAGEEIDMDDLGLSGTSDDYFLAELTLFVKKDASDPKKDEFIAAKSNLIKKTVTAEDVALETSSKTDKEYYVGADKTDGDKVITGYMTLGGIKAYLDIENAPYSYKKLGQTGDNEKGSVQFIDMISGAYDEEDSTFEFDLIDVSFDGDYKETGENGAYDVLTTHFDDEFPTVYNDGLYEADVYDVNGDGYAEYIFVKNYNFTQIIDKKNKSLGDKFATSDGHNLIYTEDATIEGDYDSEDYILAYVNFDASYVKIAETITPIESMVSSKVSSDDSKAITFKSGEVVEFIDADKKFVGFKDYTIDGFTPGKTYKAFIKDGVLLYRDTLSSGDFDADADYALVIVYDDEQTSYRIPDEAGTIKDDRVVFTATGVVDGVFKTYYYVNAVIGGAVKAVKLSDYANTHYSWDGNDFTTNEDNSVESQKITDKTVAESVMYHDFLNKFSTYTIDSEGGYVFTALDFSTDTADFNDPDNENAVYLTADAASIKNYTGSIYSASGITGISKFNVKDYSQLIIKTIDDDGEDVYTLYTLDTLPKFDTTVFENVMAVFVNNKSSNIENLGILYAEIDEFGSKATKDYRIVVGSAEIVGENGKAETVINVLNIKDATVTSNVELASGVTAPATGSYVAITEDGKADTVKVGTEYVENVLFEKTFNKNGSYDADNKFLSFSGDSNTYLLTEDTTILYYTSTSIYSMVEDDILTVEDNSYEGLEDLESFKVQLVAEDNDDNDSDDSIKIVKTIVVRK